MESKIVKEVKALHEGIQIYFSVSGCTVHKEIFTKVCATLSDKYRLVKSPFVADVVVAYLCALSDEEIMDTANIMALLKLVKQRNPECKIIVGGCVGEIVNLKLLYPFIDIAYGKNPTATEILHAIGWNAPEINEFVPVIRHGVGIIQIGTGCMRNCSFCKKAYLPMKLTSKPIDLVLAEVKQTLEKGVTCIYLVCENSTEYGRDIYGEVRLKQLLQEILANNPKICGIFLAGLAIDEIDHDLLDYFANEPKISQLQVEIQSLDSNVRQAMGLKPSPKWTIKVINTLKNRALLTNVMLGHPGETESGFRQQLKAIRRNNWWFIEVNKFINTYGTPSYGMEQIPEKVVESRMIKMAEMITELRQRAAEKFIEESKTTPVQALVEDVSEERTMLMAVSAPMAIIIDPTRCSQELKPGELIGVRLNSVSALASGGYQIMVMKGEVV